MTIRTLLATASILALLARPGHAASFDCATPADPWQASICGEPGLSRLEAAVAATYASHQQATAWPHGLRARHEAAMARLRPLADPEAIRRGFEARLAALREEAGWMGAHGLEGAPDRQVREACLALIPEEGDSPAQRARPCRVADFAPLPSVDGRGYAYALYAYTPDPTGAMPHETALVVFAAGQTNEWTVAVAERLAFANCLQPRVVTHGTETFLHLPCQEVGTAGAAIPLLYRRTGPAHFRRWEAIEGESWRAAAEARAPSGTRLVGSGMLDPRRMTATFILHRDSDGFFSGTSSGRAEARLAIEEDRLVLRDLAILPPQTR